MTGLATRHSLVYRHEESPAWVSRAWLNLQHFSHGVCLALTLHLSQVSKDDILQYFARLTDGSPLTTHYPHH